MKTGVTIRGTGSRALRGACSFLIPAALGGCQDIVLHPAGDVAIQQRDLLLMSTFLMLLIIVPVMVLTVLFAWRYRATNVSARYDPDWHHSTQLELVIWAAPLLIVICLGALTWMGTHILDPYRQIGRISPGHPLAAQDRQVRVQAVALDWKWLFIYPDLGIASVNELAAPVDQPIDFQITSSSVMNSFYVPALAGQIYAMPGMETRLHAVINRPGDYDGFSANYSGAGFSGMHFRFHGLTGSDFAQWVERVRKDGGVLDPAGYLALEQPSEELPVRHYATVAPALYHAIRNMCVEQGKMCLDEMMRIDAKGGLGLAGVGNTMSLEYDKYARRGAVLGPAPSYLASICTRPDPHGADPLGIAADPVAAFAPDTAALNGTGLRPPGPLRWPLAPPELLRTAAADPVR